MDFVPNDLFVFLVRWAHVIAGIMWIGNSFYFMWLDANLEAPEPADPKVEGKLWMVHSGGFYQVERRRIGPGSMPTVLHWFKWEATFTWLTGFLLLTLMFYFRGAALLIDPAVLDLKPWQGVGLSLLMLGGSWLIYDLLWISPLGKNHLLATVLSLGLVLALIFSASAVFSGRGAFLHLGAVFGTLMVLNVWRRILPAQSAMIAATERGEQPDFDLSKQAKARSTHNSYMTLPVIFAMLGGHLPGVSAHPLLPWIVITVVALGMALRHVMILHTKKEKFVLWLLPAALLLALLWGLLGYQPSAVTAAINEGGEVSDEAAFAIIQRRCTSCHAKQPADTTFGPMPGGLALESIESMRTHADRIHLMAVQTQAMPLINKTEMTDEERAELGRWTTRVMQP